MPFRRLNTFQKVVLMFVLAVGAGLSIAPPWEGFRPTGVGSFSRDPEPIGHYPAFSPPRPCEPPRTRKTQAPPDLDDLLRSVGIEPVASRETTKESPYECNVGEPWRGIKIAWVRVGLEFAALVFATLLLLVMGQLFRGNETQLRSGGTDGP